MKLESIRISHKISALMIGLVAGFIVIGVTYYYQMNQTKVNRLQEKQAYELQKGLSELNVAQFKMSTSTSQFIASKDSSYADEYSNSYNQATSQLQAIKDSGTRFQIFHEIKTVENALIEHKTLFAKLKVESESIGNNQNQGLRQLLASTASELETALLRVQTSDAITSFAHIRSVESEVVSGQRESALQEIQTELESINAHLLRIKVGEIFERSLLGLISEYKTNIEKIAQAHLAINDSANQLQLLERDISAALSNSMGVTLGATEELISKSDEQTEITQAVVTAIIFLVAVGTAVGIYLIYKSIIFPMAHIQSVISRINKGRTNARVKHLSKDELGELGLAFNKLLDERIKHLEEQSGENDKLNNSIISLITALGTIAKKDLTVRVPVSSDITGAVSDAVNLLTSETAKTLHEVRNISNDVNEVSNALQNQSDKVMQFASNERRQVIATSKALEVLARAMTDIAERSDVARSAAGTAINNTQSARKTVDETVQGIRVIRETISETEKRMKRLGDRSQEISGIVNLINTIAERTHILALNASMHAASAGEAGKGFAVVADEVQRLAESARESTDEISSMVNNIRVETSDTVNVMNTLIEQVAAGTKLAEQAGNKMTQTETATQELVESVKAIAAQATNQSDIANKVRDRATIIRSFTEKTAKQLTEQRDSTDELQRFAASLVDKVSIFSLPEYVQTTSAQDGSRNISPLKIVEPRQASH